MTFKNLFIPALLAAALCSSCSHRVPAADERLPYTPNLVPDYEDVTIPCNIAPMNFRIDEEADDYLTRIQVNGREKAIVKGRTVCTDVTRWHQWLQDGKGGTIAFEVYLKKAGRWIRYAPVRNYIAKDSIDSYLTYRLIAPSYITFKDLSIVQRNLTGFGEKVVYSNRVLNSKEKTQCINCHSFQNYRTGHMQLHVRADYGGTLLLADRRLRKVTLKYEGLLSPGVYPSWHPTENLIAYSVNNIGQFFHKRDIEKVEVQDEASDLILFDVDKNQISIIRNDSSQLETFPSWSPDGRYLYYVTAPTRPVQGTTTQGEELITHYREVRYALTRLAFDPKTKQFGEPELVYNAPAQGQSASFPRVSPDGRYLLYTSAEFGNFHIWHKSADLHLVDLLNGKERKLENVNSPDAESYHCWSSNGRWIVFSSRRDDGSYTRPYIAWFDANGKAGKPFVLPQKSPGFYESFYYSFNVPEFTIEPIRVSVGEMARTIRQEPLRTGKSK